MSDCSQWTHRTLPSKQSLFLFHNRIGERGVRSQFVQPGLGFVNLSPQQFVGLVIHRLLALKLEVPDAARARVFARGNANIGAGHATQALDVFNGPETTVFRIGGIVIDPIFAEQQLGCLTFHCVMGFLVYAVPSLESGEFARG